MRRTSPEMQRWIDEVKWDDAAHIRESLLELFKLGAQNAFTPAGLNALGNLARTALATLELERSKPPTEPKALVVEVQRFGNGHRDYVGAVDNAVGSGG